MINRKNLICFIIVLLLSVPVLVIFASEAAMENSNSMQCLDAARRIGELEGVDTVAVIKKQGRIIAGVRCTQNMSEKISRQSESIIKGIFPSIKDCRVEAENELAQKIIELSYFIDTDMENSTLESRFNFLWNI